MKHRLFYIDWASELDAVFDGGLPLSVATEMIDAHESADRAEDGGSEWP